MLARTKETPPVLTPSTDRSVHVFLEDRFDASIGTWQDGKILDKKKLLECLPEQKETPPVLSIRQKNHLLNNSNGCIISKKKEIEYDRKRSILLLKSITITFFRPPPALAAPSTDRSVGRSDRFDASIGTWQDGKILDNKK
ncbi:hypothetical protein CEXT_197641 [Caerostris extrusa]|uniref:Uncharacterized protein n=1 Tax=Caerostris extrusa TaxID=172846 RepID=A0AAV4NV70_CAEEX|nr:hypothetical protein CEXT_197641 [Caerostris extrusa]